MQEVLGAYPPKNGRMHEACGPGAVFFAATVAAGMNGTVVWVRERWRVEQINPLGLVDLLPPERLLVASAETHTDLLATAEESLRSGVVPLVVMELNSPLDLTTGRRLQLAAQAGKATALAIIPEGVGSNAAETRWHCRPAFDPADSTLQIWELIKNKSGTLGAWNVRWSQSARRIAVVSKAGL